MPGLFRHPPHPQQRRIQLPPAAPAAGSAILFVIADAGAPGTPDQTIKSRLEGQGHTVTYISDETAEASSASYDLAIISESCASGTVAAKYKTWTKPVLHMEHGAWDDCDLANAGTATPTGTDVDVVAPADPIAAGYSGVITVAGSTTDIGRTTGVGPGAVTVIEIPSSSDIVGFRYESGATGLNSFAMPARRVGLGWHTNLINSPWQTNAQDIFDAAVEWLLGTGGGSNVSVTASDTLGLADSITRTGTFARSPSDSLTLGNTVARVGSLLRTTSDTLGLGDSVVRTVTAIRTTADALTLGNTVTRAGTFLRATADGLGLSDSVARVFTGARSVTDTLTFGNTVDGLRLIVRTVADSLSLADAATRTLTLARSVADSISLASTVSRLASLARTASDGIGLTDTVTRAMTLARSTSDTLTLGNTVARVVGAARSATDTLGLADSLSRVGTFLRSAADGLAMATVVSAEKLGGLVSRTAADALSLADSVVRTVTGSRTASDSLTLGSIVAATTQVVIGGFAPIASAVRHVSRSVATRLRPGGAADSPEPGGSATNPKPGA